MAEWFTALATFLAVIVALFKEDIIKLWKRPALAVRIALQAPDCEKMTTQIGATPQIVFSGQKGDGDGAVSLTGGVVTNDPLWIGDVFFFRMWIENRGRQRAERVQVFISRLQRKHQDGIFRIVESFLPMNLRWANTPANATQIFADINPSMGKHCDLGAISDPANNTLAPLPGLDPGNVSLDLALEVLPNSQSHRLTPGCYRLDLRIGGANVAPILRTIEVTFSGRWYPIVAEMFADGIGIREIS